MDNLKELLMEYRDYTLKIISELGKDNYDALDGVLEQRQKIIDCIDKGMYPSEAVKEIFNELNLINIQEEAEELMAERLNHVRLELRKTSAARSVNKNYNQSGYVDSIYFNKKI